MQKKMMTRGLILWIVMSQPTFLQSQTINPNLPLDKQKFPLTIEQVLKAGLTQSIESKRIRNKTGQVTAMVAGVERAFQPTLESSLQHLHNRNEPGLQGGLDKLVSHSLTTKLSKKWVTGTTTFLELRHSQNEATLPANQLPAGSPTLQENSETVLGGGFSHPLLQNANGRDLDFSLQDLEIGTEAIELEIRHGYKELALNLVDTYMNTWFAKQQIFLNQKSLSRQRKLLRVVKITSQRGNTDKSDLLQVRSAILDIEQSILEAKKRYGDVWRLVVTNLKLEQVYGPIIHKVDPMNVLLKQPNTLPEAKHVCRTSNLVDQQQHLSYRLLELQKQRSQLSLNKAREAEKSFLSVDGYLQANGIDAAAGESFSESASMKHPMWSVSLNFKKTLGDAGLRQATHSEMQNQTEISLQQQNLLDSLDLRLHNACLEFNRLNDKEAILKQMVAMKRERANIERSDFEIGRSDVFTVIQADNDLAGTIFQIDTLYVEREKLAWEIFDLGQELDARLLKMASGQAALKNQKSTPPKTTNKL